MSDTKWICPKCAAENTPDFTHCRMCGEPNPSIPHDARTCPNGGCTTDEACCPKCHSPTYLDR